MENNKKPIHSGSVLRKTGLVAALLLTAITLSACVIPVDNGYRGNGHRHRHWNNQENWNGGPDAGWQGNGGWKRHH